MLTHPGRRLSGWPALTPAAGPRWFAGTHAYRPNGCPDSGQAARGRPASRPSAARPAALPAGRPLALPGCDLTWLPP